MSLLIKALEKAEQGKAEDAGASAGQELTLEHLEAGFSSIRKSDAEPVKHTPQQQASVVFAAKQRAGWSMRSVMLLVLVVGLMLVLTGLAAYDYMSPKSRPDIIATRPSTSAVQNSEPVALKTNTDIATHADSTVESSGMMDAISVKAEVIEASPSPKAASQVSQVFGTPIAGLPEESGVKITRNRADNAVNPVLLSAYSALNAGDDVRAAQEYRKVLASDVRNIDALLGMAAIATRQGRNEDAAGWYNKILEIEPRNTIAQTALLSLGTSQDVTVTESKIKSMLAQQPDSAYLNAALGNLYAGRSAWAAAQQAYFDAFRLEPTSADYAFNLAISLDQLGKSNLALDYYRKARDLVTTNATASVDKVQLDTRIYQLEQH